MGNNKEQSRTDPASSSDVLPIERVGKHGVETDPVSTPTTEVNNEMGGTKLDSHNLHAHERVEASGLGNLNDVMLLLSALETRLNRVEVMYLECL